jgi:hypothetical protein
MKYIILYRKLGFKETEQDVFVSQYQDCKIIIEAEAQQFYFNNEWHQLLTYKDMVKLELIDRLLKKGYKAKEIHAGGGFDLMLIDKGGLTFATFVLDEWGKRFEKTLTEYSYSGSGTVVLYASQLAGGLIDYRSVIFLPSRRFESGLVEKTAPLFPQVFLEATDDIKCENKNFVIKGMEIIKYKGSSEVVTVPQGITRIGTQAFMSNNSVKSITLSDGLECIAGDAFLYCENLESVNIPRTVEQIGDNPFAGCPRLIIKNLSENFVIEDGVLFDKDKKTLIHYTPSSKAARYEIPNGVEWLGKHSFYKCENLTSLVISKSVSFMGNNPFSDCFSIALENHSPHFKYIGGVLYKGDLTEAIHYSLGSGVEDVAIQEGVRTIGRNSFWNARTIKSITIPKTVRQIGYNPFAYCINTQFICHSDNYAVYNGALYSADFRELVCCTAKAAASGTIILHEKLESIGRSAFVGCETLTHIILPKSLKAIGRGAFSWCKGLREIEIPDGVELLDKLVFSNCESLLKLRVPKGIRIENNTLQNCPAEVIKY